VIGDGLCQPERLTVALVQALQPEPAALAPWRGGALVFDEGHHAAAATYQELIRRLEPRYHYYLSAVPFRSGADQVVLDALVGRGGRLTGGRFSAAYLIDRGYACPVELAVERVPISADVREKPFATVYRECVVDNLERNRRVAAVVREAAATHRPALVLVEHVRHGRRLLELLGDGATFVHGGTPRRALHAATERFAAGAEPCLVATSGLFAEGVSIEGIEVLVQAGGLRSRAKVIQAVGRGMRRAPGKDACLYVDFFDDDPLGVLRRHSRTRLAVLQQEGFAVPPLDPDRVAAAEEESVPPLWSHVPDSRRFVLVDGDGTLRGRAECLRREMVPDRFCQRCRQPELCRNGGRILWRDDRA
jgi:superfamily II DNA or RNA helicase